MKSVKYTYVKNKNIHPGGQKSQNLFIAYKSTEVHVYIPRMNLI